ncbi:MAG: ABC transporter permease [Planctomycetota bacterium]|nr:MAG: ABC transporter permease [Planctomycetota bacterium]
MFQTLNIAKNTLTESLRQPVVFIIVFVSGILQILSVWWSAYSMGYRSEPGDVTADDKLLFDIGLSTIFVCGMLLAAFISTAVLSREIENKTILTMVSKPLPRAAVVVGKFLGVSAAMLIAVTVMLTFLMLALRHGVLSTAADDPDQPVWVLGMGAVFLSLLISTIGNYLYSWSFPQTAMLTLTPLSLAAYIGVLLLSKKWEVQPIATDFKGQVLIACLAMTAAILVMTAVAIAASTRLGQVMTIVVCTGVFILGLLTNYFFGRIAFQNEPIATIAESWPIDPLHDTLTQSGERYGVRLITPPEVELARGMQFLYGPSPNGIGTSNDWSPVTPPEEVLENDLFSPDTPRAIVILEVDDLTLTIRNIGSPPAKVRRPPMPGDYVFAEPTKINPAAAAIWAVTPNMHFFWLVDAVSQARSIPLGHLGLIAAYAACLIVACLGIAVALFQGRDVG